MRKIIRNIKYWFSFRKTGHELKKRIEATFITEFKIPNPKIKVNFRFGYAKNFYLPSLWFGTRQIIIIREDYQHNGLISTWYSVKQYFEMINELNNIKSL